MESLRGEEVWPTALRVSVEVYFPTPVTSQATAAPADTLIEILNQNYLATLLRFLTRGNCEIVNVCLLVNVWGDLLHSSR